MSRQKYTLKRLDRAARKAQGAQKKQFQETVADVLNNQRVETEIEKIQLGDTSKVGSRAPLSIDELRTYLSDASVLLVDADCTLDRYDSSAEISVFPSKVRSIARAALVAVCNLFHAVEINKSYMQLIRKRSVKQMKHGKKTTCKKPVRKKTACKKPTGRSRAGRGCRDGSSSASALAAAPLAAHEVCGLAYPQAAESCLHLFDDVVIDVEPGVFADLT